MHAMLHKNRRTFNVYTISQILFMYMHRQMQKGVTSQAPLHGAPPINHKKEERIYSVFHFAPEYETCLSEFTPLPAFINTFYNTFIALHILLNKKR